MGCDIHTYREKQVNGQWVTADQWEPSEYEDEAGQLVINYDKRAYTGRNYALFGALAKGLRFEFEYGFEPRGVPPDACEEIRKERTEWDSDGHTHSYLYLHELRDFQRFLGTQTLHVTGMKNADELAALQASIAAGTPDWDKLYPYCQGTNDPRQVHFAVDVPALFKIGKCLQDIIDSFSGIDGDNHRLVFWFDN